jgi:hypothetical protein
LSSTAPPPLRDKTPPRRPSAQSSSTCRGQTIIEPGERVSPEQYEMFVAHRDYIRSHDDADVREGLTLFGRVLLVLAMVLASLIYIRIEDPETLRSNVRCGLLALVVIGNRSPHPRQLLARRRRVFHSRRLVGVDAALRGSHRICAPDRGHPHRCRLGHLSWRC